MAISRETLRKDIYNTIYNHLNNNIADPKSRNAHWIFPNFPDDTKPNFIGYPLIVINSLEINKAIETFDKSYKPTISFPLELTIFSTKASELDELSDSLDVALAIEISKQFTFSHFDEQYGQLRINGNNVHYRTITQDIEVSL